MEKTKDDAASVTGDLGRIRNAALDRLLKRRFSSITDHDDEDAALRRVRGRYTDADADADADADTDTGNDVMVTDEPRTRPPTNGNRKRARSPSPTAPGGEGERPQKRANAGADVNSWPAEAHTPARFATRDECYRSVAKLLGLDARRYVNGAASSSSRRETAWSTAKTPRRDDAETDDVTALMRQIMLLSTSDELSSPIDKLVLLGRSFTLKELTFSVFSIAPRIEVFLRSPETVALVGVHVYVGGPIADYTRRANDTDLANIAVMNRNVLFAAIEEYVASSTVRRLELYQAFRRTLTPTQLFLFDVSALSPDDQRFIAACLIADDASVSATVATALIETTTTNATGISCAGLYWLTAWKFARLVKLPDERAQGARECVAALARSAGAAFQWLRGEGVHGDRTYFPFLSDEDAMGYAALASRAASVTATPVQAMSLLHDIVDGMRKAYTPWREQILYAFMAACLAKALGETPLRPYGYLALIDPDMLPAVLLPASPPDAPLAPLIAALTAVAARFDEMENTPLSFNLLLLMAGQTRALKVLRDPRRFNDERFARDPSFFVSRVYTTPSFNGGDSFRGLRLVALQTLLSRDVLISPQPLADVGALVSASRSLPELFVALRAVRSAVAPVVFHYNNLIFQDIMGLIDASHDREGEWAALYCALLALMRISETPVGIAELVDRLLPTMGVPSTLSCRRSAAFKAVRHLMKQKPALQREHQVEYFGEHLRALGGAGAGDVFVSPLALFARLHGRRSDSFSAALQHALALPTEALSAVYAAYAPYMHAVQFAPVDLARMRVRMGMSLDQKTLTANPGGSIVDGSGEGLTSFLSTMLGSQTFSNVSLFDANLVGLVLNAILRRMSLFPGVYPRLRATLLLFTGCLSRSRNSLLLFAAVFRALEVDQMNTRDRLIMVEHAALTFRLILQHIYYSDDDDNDNDNDNGGGGEARLPQSDDAPPPRPVVDTLRLLAGHAGGSGPYLFSASTRSTLRLVLPLLPPTAAGEARGLLADVLLRLEAGVKTGGMGVAARSLAAFYDNNNNNGGGGES